jgi:hypothetical protein
MVMAMAGDDGGIRWHFLEGWGEPPTEPARPVKPPAKPARDRSFEIVGEFTSEIPNHTTVLNKPDDDRDVKQHHRHRARRLIFLGVRVSAELLAAIDVMGGSRSKTVRELLQIGLEAKRRRG